jgi:hypothetical protein
MLYVAGRLELWSEGAVFFRTEKLSVEHGNDKV